MIDSFTDEYAFLSNFYPAEVFLDGVSYRTVEHAFQAAKTEDPHERMSVRQFWSPGAAKRQGRRVHLRPDWDSVRVDIMESLLRQKFAPGSPLAAKLLATGDEMLVEGNVWNDTFWGQCYGTGKNMLGTLLMKIRDDLRREEPQECVGS